MKEIFDWLRDSVYLNNDKAKNFNKDTNVVNKAYVDQIITEAEAKWKEKEAEIRANVIDEFAESVITEMECFAREQEGEPNTGFIDSCVDIVRYAMQIKGEKE